MENSHEVIVKYERGCEMKKKTSPTSNDLGQVIKKRTSEPASRLNAPDEPITQKHAFMIRRFGSKKLREGLAKRPIKKGGGGR
jgi:hypothetical protein